MPQAIRVLQVPRALQGRQALPDLMERPVQPVQQALLALVQQVLLALALRALPV